MVLLASESVAFRLLQKDSVVDPHSACAVWSALVGGSYVRRKILGSLNRPATRSLSPTTMP